MEKAETYSKAIKAALAYTGQTREELARKMGCHVDTLGRKLRSPGTLTLAELIAADKAIKWSHFIGGKA